jgi:hypothetical protein
MKRVLRISILAILAFAAILLVRLPASWLKGFLPPEVACGEISGTAWNGACLGFAYNGAPAGDLKWQVHPAALFGLKFDGYVDLTRGSDFVRGDVEVSRDKTIVANNLQAQMPLDRPFLPQLRSNYSGNISVNLAHLRVEKNAVASIEGQVQAMDLYSQRDRVALGAYSATFPRTPPGTEPVGQLMTLGGPIDFTGTITLTRAPGWVLSGNLRVKPETPQAFRDQLRYFPENPDGTRQVGLEGTF